MSKRRKAEQQRANESTPKRRTRADAQQEVLLATPESDRAAEVADTPEIIRRSPCRSIRQRPTCSDFGPFRRQVFGDDYHFCAECDKWDDLTPDAKLRIRTTKIVNHIERLVSLSVIDESRAALWTIAVENYRSAMDLLRQKEDFTNDGIAMFQKHADLFFQNWVKLHGNAGVTNYIHMMGSGHFAEYLYKWRNLYQYSQQGWEAMNSMIKTFFFRRTNHGGAAGNKGTSNKS